MGQFITTLGFISFFYIIFIFFIFAVLLYVYTRKNDFNTAMMRSSIITFIAFVPVIVLVLSHLFLRQPLIESGYKTGEVKSKKVIRYYTENKSVQEGIWSWSPYKKVTNYHVITKNGKKAYIKYFDVKRLTRFGSSDKTVMTYFYTKKTKNRNLLTKFLEPKPRYRLQIIEYKKGKDIN